MDNLKNKLSGESQSQPSCLGAVMPRFIKIGGVKIEQPDADGDFEITIKDNDGGEVYRYLTNAQAQKLVDFISHFLNEA
jgi:hypothetical protein